MLPLWLKLAYTAFLAVMLPTYALRAAAGLWNFLWFSDIALIVGGIALWTESSLLASTMLVATLLPELVWNVSFFGRLLLGKRLPGVRLFGLTDYMFDPREHWYMRTLSLFHVFMPVVLIWMVARLGYDGRALLVQTAICWIVLPICYAFTERRHNINRVFGLSRQPQTRLHPLLYLALLMVAMPVVVYAPTHFLLSAWLR